MENYGKFNSAEELLKGYAELERTFTQKCQQLSALEKQLNASGTSENSSPQHAEALQPTAEAVKVPRPQDDQPQRLENITPEQVEQYLAAHKDYAGKLLEQHARRKAEERTERSETEGETSDKGSVGVNFAPLMTGGGNVSLAAPSKPKTLQEASELAKNLFK